MDGQYTVNISYTNLGGNNAECSFSNLNALSAPAEVRTFAMESEAESFMQRMDGFHTGPLFQPRFLSKQGQEYHVLGKRQAGKNFLEWCRDNAHRIWEIRGQKAIGLTPVAKGVFRGMIDGLHSLHDNGYYHGNFRKGVMISDSDSVFFQNEESPFNENDRFRRIVEDLDDFAHMVDKAMYIVDSYYNKTVEEPVAVQLFVDLYHNNFHDYPVDEEHLRFFAFFVRNNPLFLDETGLYLFCRKVVDLYEQDGVKFQNTVKLDTGNRITLKDWINKIRNPVLRNVLNFDGGINIWKYMLPHGSIEFVRNSFGHVRTNQRQRGFYIGDGGILKLLLNDIPAMVPVWFLEIFQSCGLEKNYLINGSNLMQFLSDKPSPFS